MAVVGVTILMTLAGCSASGPTGNWVLTSMQGATPQNSVTLELGPDGKFTGQASVNRYFGAWQGSEGTLAIGDIGSTRMAGPPELMNEESTYFRLLGEADRYRVDDHQLELLAGDRVILQFAR